MCALPLLALRPILPVGGPAWRVHDEALLGQEFLYHNRVPADTLSMASRAMNILLAMLFVAAVAGWTRSRFGASAGLLATTLRSGS